MRHSHALLLATVLMTPRLAAAQTAVRLAHPLANGATLTFQLTDGRVLAQGSGLSDWYILTPDATGSYVNGTWAKAASLPTGYDPDAFASAVLADGRVVVMGGEYLGTTFTLTNLGAIYNPVIDAWAKVTAPSIFPYIGDSPAVVLPDGRFLLGDKLTKLMAALDPKTLTWTQLSSTGKKDFDAEEGWTLLPNGRVLTYDVKAAPNSEIYDPASQSWHSAGSTVVPLNSPHFAPIHFGNGMVYHPPGEVGPGILRPDGTVFATGGLHKGATNAHTAIYTPPASGAGIGTWKAGPDFPTGVDAGDNFAVLLPSGNVLVETSSGELFEFNGTTLTDSKINAGGRSLMVLPTGEVLMGGEAVYRATGAPAAGWAPVITNAPASEARGSTFMLTGKQLNGLSQAAAFGDELQTATNYPIVRLTNAASGVVTYARTHDHSTMGVATGATPVTTMVDIPAGAPVGAMDMVVIANGIASASVRITID